MTIDKAAPKWKVNGRMNISVSALARFLWSVKGSKLSSKEFSLVVEHMIFPSFPWLRWGWLFSLLKKGIGTVSSTLRMIEDDLGSSGARNAFGRTKLVCGTVRDNFEVGSYPCQNPMQLQCPNPCLQNLIKYAQLMSSCQLRWLFAQDKKIRITTQYRRCLSSELRTITSTITWGLSGLWSSRKCAKAMQQL